MVRTIYDFVQLSPACGPNTYQIMYGETSDFRCQHQQWLHKMPDRKINFCINLPLKLFRATVANADLGILKSLQTILKTCLYHVLVKFEQNRTVQTTRNFELFVKKTGFFISIFDKELTPFLKTFVSLKLLFNAKLLIIRTIIFQCSKKHSDTCNQVKRCTKHGRPDQSQRELTVALLNQSEFPNVFFCFVLFCFFFFQI